MIKRTTIYRHTSALRRLVTMLLVSALSLTLASPLLGQATCFPPHEGLPLAFSPPTIDGYVEPELGVLTAEQVEGGWKLATRLTYMADTFRPLMAYQALKDNSQGFIYLSFDVRADETFDDEDVIVLDFRPAFSPAGHSANERRIDIYPVRAGIGAGTASQPNDTPPVPSGAPSSAAYNIRTNRTPRKVNLLKWNMATAAWENPIDITTPATDNMNNYDIKVRSWSPTASDNGWSVEVKLPVSKSGTLGGGTNWIDLSNDFGFYFDVIRVCGSCNTPGDPTTSGFYNVQYSWPRSKFITDPDLDNTIVLDTFEIPNSYVGEAFIGNNSACRGVRFERGSNGIGVRNAANPTGPLLYNIDGTLNATNTFVARILNDGTGTATGVKATFRIANWGIIGEDTAPWDLVPAQPGSATNTNPTQAVNIGTGSTATELTVGWKINSADRSSFKPTGPRDPHQCIWVLLDSNQDVDFADSSVHTNMNVINLSSQEEDADISGKGLPPPVSGSDHDFLLNVYQVQLFSLQDLQKGGRINLNRPMSAASNNERALNVSDLEREIYQRQAASKDVMTTWVWAVDGYRNAGGGLKIESKTFRNFQPVGSFGHVADHKGRAQGLDYSLMGTGLQKLSDHSYSLKVPDGGVARIHTKLQTRDGVNPPNPPGFKRWGVSLHAGLSIPHGNFDTVFNPGPNFGVDLEYRVTPTFSLEGIYGFHRFNGATFNGGTFGPFTLGSVNVHQFSFNGKVYGSSSPVRPFFNFGGGAYVFTPGASTHGGLNVGGGVQFDVTPNFAVDTMYNFHNVFTSGSSTQFSTLQGGVRFRF
jgi:hypothetical protein